MWYRVKWTCILFSICEKVESFCDIVSTTSSGKWLLEMSWSVNRSGGMQEMLCNVSDKRRNHCWSPTFTDSLCLYAVYETQLLVTLKLFNTAMGRRTASQETTPSGEALLELMENRAILWCFLLFSNSIVETLCSSRYPKSTNYREHRAFITGLIFVSLGSLGLLCAECRKPFTINCMGIVTNILGHSYKPLCSNFHKDWHCEIDRLKWKC